MSTKVKRPRRKPFEPVEALSEEERKQFRAILEGDVFKKAIRLSLTMKPSALHPPQTPTGAADRLHQIQGWELFEHALYLQAETPKPRTQRATETYPAQGQIDYEK